MSVANVRRHDAAGERTDFFLENAQLLSIAAFLLLCCIMFGATSPFFLSAGNLLNLLRQSAPMLIVAVAMTFVITTGGIDLSVGSTVALTNAIAAIALQAGLPWPAVAAAMLLLGAVVGAVQGWFSAYQGIPSFIVTLAGLSILRGIALLLTKGFSIPIAPSVFVQLGRGWLSAAQVPAALAVLRAAPGGEQAALIGAVDAGGGRVTLRGPYGTDRLLDLPAGELLPRIC
jgi:simple sugar transport system permease protein